MPVITVMNKSDKQTVDIEALPCKDQYVIISAKTGKGIEQLKQRISLMLFGKKFLGKSHIIERTLRFDYS